MRLHAPCGLVVIKVPLDANANRSDPNRPVSFLSVPSYSAALAAPVHIPKELCWPQLPSDKHIIYVDVTYGGAFYCFVPANEAGFTNDCFQSPDLTKLSQATRNVKIAFNRDESCRKMVQHIDSEDLGFLYSIMFVPSRSAQALEEDGICFFFADGQLDRSSTGSAVAARVALKHKELGWNAANEMFQYHSLVSRHFGSEAFEAKAVSIADDDELLEVIAEIRGYAYYTGFHTFVLEKADTLRSGFSIAPTS